MAKKKPATDGVEYNHKAIITDSLLQTGREGMPDFIQYLDEIGFFTAPCSGGNHLCKVGGLAEHSVNVMHAAQKISAGLIGEDQITDDFRNSIIITSLLHDLGKVGDFGKQMYVENILKTGKRSDAKPFKTNKDLTPVPHAVRSVKLATLYLDLTEDEEWAILTHNGLYDTNFRYDIPGNESPLSMILHWADMWASRVMEVTDDDNEKESEV